MVGHHSCICYCSKIPYDLVNMLYVVHDLNSLFTEFNCPFWLCYVVKLIKRLCINTNTVEMTAAKVLF